MQFEIFNIATMKQYIHQDLVTTLQQVCSESSYTPDYNVVLGVFGRDPFAQIQRQNIIGPIEFFFGRLQLGEFTQVFDLKYLLNSPDSIFNRYVVKGNGYLQTIRIHKFENNRNYTQLWFGRTEVEVDFQLCDYVNKTPEINWLEEGF